MLALFILSIVLLVVLVAVARTPIRNGLHRFAGAVGGFLVKDAVLKVTAVLPNGAATVHTIGIDLLGADPAYGATLRADFLANLEVLLTAPALTTTQQPDAKTTIYQLETDDDVAFGSPKVIAAACITQTGASSAGSAADTFRTRLPTDVERYLRATATGSTTGNNSASSMTLELLF